jgi:murein DD-endopeptidase MepM/ murein hydrolase activator NlpD
MLFRLQQACRDRISLGSIRRLVGPAVLILGLGACAPQRGVYHTVQPGQTLYRISRSYGVDADYLARINGIDDPTRLRAGQRLLIPGAQGVRAVPATVASAPARTPARFAPRPAAPTAPRTPPARDSGARPSAAPSGQNAGVAAPARRAGQFVWPASGNLVKSFGEQGHGGRKGIEIAVPLASPIQASAAGKVIYSGDSIQGYGHLIILNHDDGFFTVYGFNQKNLVAVGSFVSQGQQIALAGTPPGQDQARLHFEIRRGKEALNPTNYLSAARR